MTLEDVNGMHTREFVEAFGGIAEHSPWVAELAAAERPFASREAMVEAFCAAVRKSPRDRQHDLICAHPDLATRAKLTSQSSREQKGAGLDSLTQAELARFTD